MHLLTQKITGLVIQYFRFLWEHALRRNSPGYRNSRSVLSRFDRFALMITAISYSLLILIEVILFEVHSHPFQIILVVLIPSLGAALVQSTGSLFRYRNLATHVYSLSFILLFLYVRYIPGLFLADYPQRPINADYLLQVSLVLSQILRPGTFPGFFVVLFAVFTEQFVSENSGNSLNDVFHLLFLVWTGVISLFVESMLYITIIGYTELKEQRKRSNDEMELARKVYNNLFPAFRSSENLTLNARKFSENITGGDFYDVIQLREGNLGFFLADVSGHGVSSAMMSAALKGILYRMGYRDRIQPENFMNFIDSVMTREYGSHHASAIYLFFDFQDRKVKLANAGHPPVLMARNGETFREVRSEGTLLGYGLGVPIAKEVVLPLHRGDRYLLYTDGFLEYETHTGDIGDPPEPEILFQGLEAHTDSDLLEKALERITGRPDFHRFRDDVMLVLLEVTGTRNLSTSRHKMSKKSLRAPLRS